MTSDGPVVTPDASGGGDDAVAAIRDAVESADDLPLDRRVETFERANEVLARELALLDEV